VRGARADPSTATISCRQVVAVGSGVNVRTNVHPAPTSERERQRENDNNRTMQPFLSFGVIVGYPVVLSYALVFTLVRWRAATRGGGGGARALPPLTFHGYSLWLRLCQIKIACEAETLSCRGRWGGRRARFPPFPHPRIESLSMSQRETALLLMKVRFEGKGGKGRARLTLPLTSTPSFRC
jgi:hypothetical protein